MIKKVLLSVSILLLCSTFLYAGTTGKIFGTVLDQQTGEPLAGANVIIEGTTLGAAADIDGEFYIINVPPGLYLVTASMIGYKSQTFSNVRVVPDYTTDLSFSIGEEVLTSEVIAVVADRPLIQRDETFSAIVTSAEDIENMPVNNINDVMSLSAGFVVTGNTATDNGTIHLRGGRANEIVYMVDGFSVSDPAWGGVGTEVPTSGIQDLSMITGGFSAEYGEAMSGVINIVTKEGTKDFHANSSLSTDQFGIDEYDFNSSRGELSLSGPIPIPRDLGEASFFLTGDYFDTDTYLRNSTSYVHDNDGNPITRNHDSKTMRSNQRYVGKIVWRPIDWMKFMGGFNHFDEKRKGYSHYWKAYPTHYGFDYETTSIFYGSINITFDDNTFISLRASTYHYNYMYKYKDKDQWSTINTPKATSTFDSTATYEFAGPYLQNGVNVISDDDYYEDQNNWKHTYAAEITSQVDKNHMVKAGLEYNHYYIDQYWADGINSSSSKPGLPETEVNYDFKPNSFSAFILDKMEFKTFVLNIGLRYDRLYPKGRFASDPTKPMTLDKYAKPKSQLSPRIGIGFPVTEKVKFHFSYGHFFKYPEFRRLFQRYHNVLGYDISQGFWPTLGNANLKPEKTVAYEFGTRIAISDEVVGAVSIFYKDTYNYISTKKYAINPDYFAIVNMDYANSQGFEIGVRKKFSNKYSFDVNYTYAASAGNTDDFWDHWNDEYDASVTGIIPPKRNVTVGWDQTHTFNFQLDYRIVNDWGVNLAGTFGSGFPYTPTDVRGKYLDEVNSARRPWTGTVDMRINKDFHYFGFTQIIFANVWNVLDKVNVINVFANTGKPDDSADPGISEEGEHRPHWYGPPRTIELGVKIIY